MGEAYIVNKSKTRNAHLFFYRVLQNLCNTSRFLMPFCGVKIRSTRETVVFVSKNFVFSLVPALHSYVPVSHAYVKISLRSVCPRK